MNNIKKITIFVILVTLLGKVLGFLREILIGNYFGVTNISDALFTALSIPTILFSGIALAYGTSFIPIYTEVLEKKGKYESDRFTSNILNIVFGITILIVLVCFFTSKQIVTIFAPGFDKDTLALANSLTRIILPTIIFVALTNIMSSYHQANSSYLIPNIVVIPQNIVVILALLISQYIGAPGVVWSYVLGALIQVLILYFTMRSKSLFVFSYEFKLKENHFIKLNHLFIPILLSTMVQQLSLIVDRSIASLQEGGGVSAFNYANTLNNFVFGIVSTSISTIIFPILSKAISKKNTNDFNRAIDYSFKMVNILIIPIVYIILVYRVEIVQLVFQRGQFGVDSTIITSDILGYYCIGMLFFGYRDILNRIFYSIHDTKTPMYNGIIAVVFNIILSLILSNYYGLNGVALATSITSIITTLMLFFSLSRGKIYIPLKNIIVNFFKCNLAGVIMMIGLIYLGNITLITNTGDSLQLLIKFIFVISISLIFYSIMLILLKVKFIEK